jgi:rubrerythrin
MSDVRLIDANALKEWLGCDGDNKYRSMIMHEIADRIDEQPAIDAVPVVHGKWESCWEDWRHQLEGNKCSVCGFEYFGNLFKYCPNCGAKMDGGAEG